jgi:membrane associated rhomboid family serine protease
MPRSAREPASDFEVVVGWLAVVWGAFIIDVILRATCKVEIAWVLGVRPRTPEGLLGILFAPFLHASLEHLLANSIGLLLLGMISCSYGRRLTGIAVIYGMVLSGATAWIWGLPGSVHIGASGVVFALIGFLLANGLFRRGLMPIIIALVTLALYGAALVTMQPVQPGASVHQLSWEMHLGGFIGGVIASWRLRHRRVR